jgi:hypothetical protein
MLKVYNYSGNLSRDLSNSDIIYPSSASKDPTMFYAMVEFTVHGSRHMTKAHDYYLAFSTPSELLCVCQKLIKDYLFRERGEQHYFLWHSPPMASLREISIDQLDDMGIFQITHFNNHTVQIDEDIFSYATFSKILRISQEKKTMKPPWLIKVMIVVDATEQGMEQYHKLHNLNRHPMQ